jgi:tRNA threonylcarbamoyladenosine biosynthesis protein TsaB
VKILAIDTTGKTVTAALASEDAVIGEVFINGDQNHSITLMPMIEYLLGGARMAVSDLTHIACSAGPGSFTGLRIGAATAKALAYAADIPIVAVPTLDALAYNISDAQSVIVPIMDARRRQVYTAYYERRPESDDLIRLSDYRAIDVADVLREVPAFAKPVIFLGDAVSVYRDVILNAHSGGKRVCAPLPSLLQRASSVARLAVRLALEGGMTDSLDFTPFYLRQSQAERERK